MVFKRPILSLAVLASLTAVIPAGNAVAGGDVPPQNPSVVGQPITRTGNALDAAVGAIDEGKGATAAGPLRASRKYLIRSYNGARFVRLARRHVRSARSSASSGSGWIKAQTSQDDAVGPVIADTPTAVFNVFTSQYDAATAAIGMVPDTTGNLLNRVRTVLNTAIVLRNRLVKIVAAAEPPVPADDAQAAQDADDVATFATVMPGLIVLLNDEIQQMQATMQDNSVPAASSAVLSNALAADNQIATRLNTLWPPVVDD
jgi:hypothetical protein